MEQTKKPHSELFFDPTAHPDDTLKAFEQFAQQFELRYDAQFPDPPKVSLDGAIARWKVQHATNEVPDPKPTLNQYDEIVSTWQSKDKVAKFLGMFTSSHFYTDWQVAQPDADQRKAATWTTFYDAMKIYYKPTENMTLKRYLFRGLVQDSAESFASFVNRTEKEAKHCNFKCHHDDCTAESTAIADQVIYNTTAERVREEAILKDWELPTLRREGTKMESAAKGGATISGEALNRLGAFSHKNIRNNMDWSKQQKTTSLNCFNCGQTVNTPIKKHVRKDCPAIGKKCDNCGNKGHLTPLCRKAKVNQVTPAATEPVLQQSPSTQGEGVSDPTLPTYNINVFQLEPVQNNPNSVTSQPSEEAHANVTTSAASSTTPPPPPPPTTTTTIDTAITTAATTSTTTETSVTVEEKQSSTTPSTFEHATPSGQLEYDINIFRIKASKNKVLPTWKSQVSNDFRAPVVVNNSLASPIADTGAKVSVCGSVQAKRWKLLDRMLPSPVKLKPYNSLPISVLGVARCAVTFGSTSIPVEWYIISGSCEPILAGDAALQLGIIKFTRSPDVFHPVLMIDKEADGSAKEKIQSILQKYPHNF